MERTSGPRTRLDVDRRREQLLDAGVELFAARSWEEVSIDEIAAACGVSRGLLYHYFKGKRGFYLAAVEQAVQRLHESIEPDLALPPIEQLLTGLRRHFEGVERHAAAHMLLIGASVSDDEVAAIVARDREAFAERVLAGLPGSGGGSPLARATARAWVGAVGAATHDLIDRREATADQLVAILAESLAAGMLAAARLDPGIEVPEAIVAAAGGGIVDAIEAAEGTSAALGAAPDAELPSRDEWDR